MVKITSYEQNVFNQTLPSSNPSKIGTVLRFSHSGTSFTGVGLDSMYGLGECYGDLSTDACV